jgi:hypothetical protein
MFRHKASPFSKSSAWGSIPTYAYEPIRLLHAYRACIGAQQRNAGIESNQLQHDLPASRGRQACQSREGTSY